MKNYFLTAVLFFCFTSLIAQNSADEMEVRKINEAYDKAIMNSDLAFYERVLAPNYVSYEANGNVKNKQQVLEEVKKQKENPTYRISKLGSDDVKIKLAGNIAVVTAKWNSTTHSMEDDEPHQDLGNYIAVYEKTDGRWQVISEMGSEKPHTPEELEPSLKKASEKYNEYVKKNDKEAFKKLLAEDYFSTNPEGEVRSRDEEIAMMFHPDLKMESISTQDKKFKVFKDFAVETGQYNVTGTYQGEKFSESGRYTSTWMLKDGKWQIIADHTSRLPMKN